MSAYILILLAGIFYMTAFISAAFSKNESSLAKLPTALASLAVALQVSGLTSRFINTGTVFQTPYDLLEVFVLIFALAILFSRIALKLRFVEYFSMLPIAILTLLPFLCPVFFSSMTNSSDEIKQTPTLASMHGILAAISYAGMCLASLFAIMHILQQKLLISKKVSRFGSLLPSISSLYKMMKATLAVACIFMIFSFAFALVSIPENITNAYILKFICGTTVLVIIGTTYALVSFRTMSERKLSIVILTSTVTSLLLLLPIELKDYIL